MFRVIVLLVTIIGANTAVVPVQRNITRKFPDAFTFGAATSSYQIEGGWNADGKGEHIWDRLVQTNPGNITDRSNGQIAANSYNLYKRDVEMLQELGVSHYRFSISWPRILPNGNASQINQKGVNYYNNLINELLAKNITPFVTMYHWELPQTLQDSHGWLSDDMQNWFGEYARILYRTFGDRVKNWITINEPTTMCNFAYGIAYHAPLIKMPGFGDYMCGRNVLLGHARAWHIYNNEFRNSQRGQVGIAIDGDWVMPSTSSTDDLAATNDYRDFNFGQFMDPIFSRQGNYPPNMISRVALISSQQGYLESRLKPFTTEQVNYIRGSSDFLGLNHYSSYYVYRNTSVATLHNIPSKENDAYYGRYQDTRWPATGSNWIREYPEGLYNILIYIKNTYNTTKIYITENGMAAPSGLNDDTRVSFMRKYLNAVLDAIDSGVNVQGYTAWSLMDTFEWNHGYTLKFGLYEVDMKNSRRPRTARKSALIYKDIIKSRFINMTYNPVMPDGAFSTSASGGLIVVLLALFNFISF